MEKGSYGYINHKKREQLIKTIIMFSLAALVFITGYILNNNSKQNLFTVFAVLLVLPAAKQFIGFIILFPYRSVNMKEYEEVKSRVQSTEDLFTDLVFTSSEKVMHLSYLFIKDDNIICFYNGKKEDDKHKHIQDYFERLIMGRGLSFHIHITKDYQLFLKQINKALSNKVDLKDKDEFKNLLKSLIV